MYRRRKSRAAQEITLTLLGHRLAWCGRRDSNPGSLAWKASVLTRLDDDRISISSFMALSELFRSMDLTIKWSVVVTDLANLICSKAYSVEIL